MKDGGSSRVLEGCEQGIEGSDIGSEESVGRGIESTLSETEGGYLRGWVAIQEFGNECSSEETFSSDYSERFR